MGAFHLMVLLSVVGASTGSYQLEVILGSYNNPKSQVSSGHCCEPPTRYPPSCSSTSTCDPFFTLNVTSSNESYTTPVYPNTDTLSLPNTTVYTFYGIDTTWPEDYISLNITAHDYNEKPRTDFTYQQDVKTIQYFNFTISTQNSQNNSCSFKESTIRRYTNYENGYIELSISYRLIGTSTVYLSCPVIQESDMELCEDTENSQEREGEDHRCLCTEGHSNTYSEQTETCTVYSALQDNRHMCSKTILVNTSSQVENVCDCLGEWIDDNCNMQTSPTMASTFSSGMESSSCTMTYILGSPHNQTESISPSAPSYPSNPHVKERSRQEDIIGHYIGLFVGGFMAGLAVAGLAWISITIYFKRRVKKKLSKLMYVSRTERNPLYQSAEDLVDGAININTSSKHAVDSLDNGGGYETLKSLSLTRGTGKLHPLKKENGYFYCLSPTDPPVPLRSVTIPNPFYEVVNSQGHHPQKLHTALVGHCARKTTKPLQQGSDGYARPIHTRSCDELAPTQSQSKSFPIYELPQLLQHGKSTGPTGSMPTQSPALPRRGKLLDSVAMDTLRRPPSLPPPPPPPPFSSHYSKSAESLLFTGGGPKEVTSMEKSLTSKGEEKAEQEESVIIEANNNNTKPGDDTVTPVYIESLYSKVKKPPKTTNSQQRKVKVHTMQDTEVAEPHIN